MFQIDPGIAIIIGLALIAGGVVYFTHRRKADKPAAAAPVPVQAVPVAAPPAATSPAAPAPVAAAIVQLARAPDGTVTPVPVAAAAPPAAVASDPPPAPIQPPPLPAEFGVHDDGTIWWRDPVRGVEMGPCASLNEAIELRNKVAARDWAQDPRNPESQQATADVPGVGFPVMPKAQVDSILANFDASIAAGHEDKAWYQLTSQEHFALQNRGMSRTDINAMIGKYN